MTTRDKKAHSRELMADPTTRMKDRGRSSTSNPRATLGVEGNMETEMLASALEEEGETQVSTTEEEERADTMTMRTTPRGKVQGIELINKRT